MSNRDQGMPKPPAPAPEALQQEEPSLVSIEPKAPDSEVAVEAPVKSGIEVVALRAGFHRGSRRDVGERFLVKSMDRVGDWMKCVDVKAEKQHQQNLKLKKDGLKKAKADADE